MKNKYIQKLDWQKRAEASERTVQILSKKLSGFLDGTEKTVFSRQLEKSQKRQEEARRKQELLEVKRNQLEQYSKTLEVEVKQRTQEIRNIVDNVSFGFFIVDEELMIQKGFTNSCLNLFSKKKEQIEGANLLKILGLSKKECENFECMVEQVFEDLFPEDVSLGQIPQYFKMKDNKTISLSAATIRNEDGEIESLLFSMDDATEFLKAEAEANHGRVIIKILKNKDSFSEMIEKTKLMCEELSQVNFEDKQKDVRRVFHTIKGNFALFGLKHVSERVHEIEDKKLIEMNDLIEIEARIKDFLEENYDVLNIRYQQENDKSFKVTKKEILSINSVLMDGNIHEVMRWFQEIQKKPFSEIMSPLIDMAKLVAAEEGKDIKFVLSGEDHRICPETYGELITNLHHIVRNSICHGIEKPNLRGDKDKRGKLSVSLHSDLEGHTFTFQDDGRGIDFQKLRQNAIDKNIDVKNIEDTKLIFVDGLSTKDEIDGNAGRGVGMPAILKSVESSGGSIKVISIPNEGTKITIKLKKVDQIVPRMAS